MHRARPLLLALLAIGCGSTSARDDLGARVVMLESQVLAAERRADAAVTLLERVEALEAALATPPPGPDAEVAARLAALEAKVAALQAQVAVLEAQATAGPTTAPTTAPTPNGAPADPLTIRRGPPGVTAPPPDGAALEVLSTGSGALLLARAPTGGLVRVALLGVDAPERAEVYAARPDLRARHAAALGPGVMKDDAAFEASRAHLEALVRQGTVTLTYAQGRPQVLGGEVVAYVVVTPAGGQPIDVNAAMLRDGYAVAAATDHPRAAQHAELEAEARGARRGLFAP